MLHSIHPCALTIPPQSTSAIGLIEPVKCHGEFLTRMVHTVARSTSPNFMGEAAGRLQLNYHQKSPQRHGPRSARGAGIGPKFLDL